MPDLALGPVGGALAFFSLMTIIWRGVDDLGWSGVVYVLVYAVSILMIFQDKRLQHIVGPLISTTNLTHTA